MIVKSKKAWVIGGILLLWGLMELPQVPKDDNTDTPQEPPQNDEPFPPNVNLCINKLCQNGTCDPLTGVCVCNAGWSGSNCEIENSFDPQRVFIIV